VDLLIGDASKAQKILGWKPTYDFRELIKEMVESDLAAMSAMNETQPLRNHTVQG